MSCDRRLRCLCLILSLTILFACFPLSVFAEEENVSFFSVTDDLEYMVDASVVTMWDTFANLEFVVTNTGENIIHNWYYTFDLPYSIEGIWGAEIFENNNEGVYTIKNAGWNQDILPGNSVNFGMTVSLRDGNTIGVLPTFYLLNTEKALIDSCCYNVSYQEYSNWGTGYNGALLIVNSSSALIEDWQMSFCSSRIINEVAGTELAVDDQLYVISNSGSNQNINPYSTLNLTVVGCCNNDDEMMLNNIELYAIKCAYRLTEDENQNGTADYIDFINGLSGNPDITPTPTVTPIPSVIPTNTPAPTITGEPTPTPDPELDSDNDGIPDLVEVEMGTDPSLPDSDDDGVDDNIEAMLGLDPLSDDSDGDGIADGQEDDDEDGLTLVEEIYQGTYTWTDDTDADGISDGNEVHVHGTDPLNEDTDGDSIEDGDELKLGTDPLVPDSDGDGIPDGEERFLQIREEEISDKEMPLVNKVEITLEGTGCLDSVMTIEDTYGKDKYSSELVGLIGSPVEISYDGEFSEATITFHYDANLLPSTKPIIPEMLPIEDDYITNPRSLGIFYYDEEIGMYIDCNATVDTEKQTITCTTTHFSTYMVADTTLWYYFWTSMKYVGDLHPSNEGYQGIDYVLEIPYITSMTDEDISEMNEIAYQLIDHMRDGDRMVIRGWNSGGVYQYEYSIDKTELREQVGKWPWKDGDCWVGYQSGPRNLIGTSLNGMEIFNIAYSTNYHNKNNEIVVIAFHNSTDIDCQFFSTYHRSVQEMTAYIFTLSSGNSAHNSLKWLNVASGGGVIDCEGKTAEEVYNEFAILYDKRQGEDLDPHASDSKVGDGLWDIYEEQGMLSSNGRFYKANPNLVDTDGDTLEDGYEMGDCWYVEVGRDGRIYLNGFDITDDNDPFHVENQYIKSTFSVFGTGRWTIYWVESNPQMKDSDNDEIDDSIDADPNRENSSITYILYDDSDWFLEYEMFLRTAQKVSTGRVELVKIMDKTHFIHVWNTMGENVYGKQEYAIDEVILVFHGGDDHVGKVYVVDVLDDSTTNALERKRINTLVLSSCNGGNITKLSSINGGDIQKSDNIATAFTSWGTIGEVYAWNGKASFVFAGTVHLCFFDFHYTIEHSWDINDGLFGAYVKTVTNVAIYSIIGCADGVVDSFETFFADVEKLSEIGRVRYYINSEGKIAYEKVPNSSLSVDLALYSS